MKRVVWKEGDLVSLKLKDDLYTFAQMCRSPYMRFFDLRTGLKTPCTLRV
ncbi:hypothetical protein LEP1GSC051_2980 [Leptospira sp. P2653]|nr:hypothetical protein LEP1GSC051_2980 [Leptospira sp. P2653]